MPTSSAVTLLRVRGIRIGVDYSWFFVTLKHSQVLWIASATTGQLGEAYQSCKNAGLTPDSPVRTGANGPDD